MARFTLPRWITWDREGLNAEQIPNSPLRYRFTKDFRGAREWPYDSVLFFVAQYQGKYREAVRTSDGLMYVVQLPNGTYEPRRGALPRATVTLPATSTTSSVSGDVLAIQRRLNQLPSSLARLVEDGNGAHARWRACRSFSAVLDSRRMVRSEQQRALHSSATVRSRQQIIQTPNHHLKKICRGGYFMASGRWLY